MKSIKTLKDEITSKLIRKDGKLNSPAIKSSNNSQLVAEATNIVTTYIGDVDGFAQVWWHIWNETLEKPKCKECYRYVSWKQREKKYNQYCSQSCAATSSFARERTKKHKTGVIRSEYSKNKQSNTLKGYTHSEETKQKLSNLKKGENNHRFQKIPWNYGLRGPANPNFGKKRPGTGMVGNKNPNYGKPPAKSAGKGISGKFNDYHFRSSLELFYLIFWYENDTIVKTAETNEFRVEYLSTNGTRTYSPDFFLTEQNLLVEIKPEKLHNNKEVVNKLEALKKQHKNKHCKIIGFKEIGSFIRTSINDEKIEHYIKHGILQITSKQYNRLIQNYGDIIRSTF